MSNPPNVLDKFNSYSALHTLIMCDGMKTANLLYDNNEAFDRTFDDPEGLFDVNRIQSTDGTSDGQYIVLFDGRNDASYSIVSASWETVFAPTGALGESKFDVIETEGEMVIEEPFGVEFLEVLVKGTREMEVDPSSVVFMLKTYFVGYGPNGQQEVINDIRPFTFIMIDLTADMKASGSTYNISLFGTANGASNLPQISSIASGMIVPLVKGSTLKEAFTALQKAIEGKYNSFKNKLRESLEADLDFVNNAEEANTLLSERFRDVKYSIILSDEYKKPEYIIGDNESHNKNNSTQEFSIKCSERSTIESCISEIMKLCKVVVDEGVENKQTQRSYSPKIVSALAQPDEDSTFRIDYYINRYETRYQKAGEPFTLEQGEFLEFDYIYTGKNVDILDFDIKMDMGLSFFNTQLGVKSSYSSQQQTLDKSNNSLPIAKNGTGIKMNDSLGTDKLPPRQKAPLFLGQTVRPESFTDKINPLPSMSFDQALARQAELESIQGRVKITGNPQLLNESLSTDYGSLNTVADSLNTGSSNQYTRPGYVKINIKFPSSKDLTSVKKFWYDGFYSIFSIKNEFKDGVFTQVLDLFSVPSSSSVPASLASALPVQNNTESSIDSSGEPSQPVVLPEYEEGQVKLQLLPSDDGGEFDKRRDDDTELFVKFSARIDKMEPEITKTYSTIVAVWKELAPHVRPVITSGNDSDHKDNSLHYNWHAIDLRTNNLDSNRQVSIELGNRIEQELKIRLGNDYDIDHEVFPTDYFRNHIHLEYDPDEKIILAETEHEGSFNH